MINIYRSSLLACILDTHTHTNLFSDCIGESGERVIGLAAKPGLKENIQRQLHYLCCREIEEFQLKGRKVVVDSSTFRCSLIDERIPDERVRSFEHNREVALLYHMMM